MITPVDVIEVLNKAKISFVLIGAYGLAGWMKQARATDDVDLVVAAKHLKKTVEILARAFPQLEINEEEVVIRLREKDTKTVVIDVVKPTQPHLRVIFKNTTTARLGKQEYRVPSLEMALALKFAPLVSPNRMEEKKLKDASDFIVMVKENSEINELKLSALGDLVYPGGGQEVLKMVHTVQAGKKLIL